MYYYPPGTSNKISTRDEVIEYFDYTVIMDILSRREDDGTKAVRRDFLGIVEADVKQSKHDIPLSVILQNQDTCLGDYFAEPGETGGWQLNAECLLEKLGINKDVYRDSLLGCTDNGALKILSEEQAYTLLCSFALFAWVEKAPDETEQRQIRDRLGPAKHYDASGISITEPESEYSGFPGDPALKTLKTVVLRHDCEGTCLVRLKGSPLCRHLEPGEELIALMANGEIAAFAPRICAAPGQVMYSTKDGVVSESAKGTQKQLLEIENPRFFAESREYGFLAVGEKQIRQKRFRGRVPEGKICWLSTTLDDYGFLTEAGAYVGKEPCKAWESQKLLCFDLSTGGGVAITAERKAIDRDGTVLGYDVASASCFGDHYILLFRDGTVRADGQEEFPHSSVRAVCADAEGYWLSTDEQLFYYGHRDTSCAQWDSPMEEIVRDGMGTTVCGLSTDGAICFLKEG